ncbi:hypothetical protein ACIOC2_27790 [Streptomyces sp. NPDC088337]|uniref:hypothetical protein n=1 Tax=unclassified Streptomyces TaxID=2593676 RepID=UPI002DDBB41F|nr:hypothetical protein [Streptomyces sp. NBC_01788]WSB29603.1 hypothetical protein OIE49_28985 [Streptomyces sp. NBC_01788]
MRARIWLTGAALGAALLTGGTVATAQAAPATSVARTYTDIGTFPSQSACLSFGRAGVYSDWYCQKSSTTSNWHLWVNLNS